MWTGPIQARSARHHRLPMKTQIRRHLALGLSRIRHHASLITSMIFCGGAVAADAPGATLATDDTSVQVEVRGEQLVLVAFKSARTSWNWSSASELPLITTLEVRGQ